MRLLLFIVLLVYTVGVYGQSGNYFLSHYSLTQNQFDNVCFDMAQRGDGFMYFATRGGVQEFDGRNWEQLPGQGAVYSLVFSANGTLYWGGAAGWGKVTPDASGLPSTQLVEAGKNVFQGMRLGTAVYFISEESIYVIAEGQAKSKRIQASEKTGAFTGIFELYGTPYVNTTAGVLYKIDQDKLTRAPMNWPANEAVVFIAPFQDQYLVGLTNNKIYKCAKNLRMQEVVLADQEYVSTSVLVNATAVSGDLFALGTLRGGVVFINASGKTQQIINYATGLPDNEVFSLRSDKDQCLWVAHEYGFTRIAPDLPLRSFSHYAGLQGNLLCARTHQGQVYVGTSVGLFKLEKQDVYEEVVYYVDAVVAENTTKSEKKGKKEKTEKKEEVQEKTEPTQDTKRGGIFRLFRRHKKDQSTSTSGNASAGEKNESKPQALTKKVKKTQRILRASQYTYRRVDGVDAKVSQLLSSRQGKLIASGLSGVYEVDGLTTRPIVEEPARFIHVTADGQLLVSTYEDKVLLCRYEAGVWKDNAEVPGLDDQVNYIFEGAAGEVWLCALEKMYRYDAKGLATVAVANAHFDEFVGVRYKQDIIIANPQGFFVYRPDKQAFDRIDSLSAAGIEGYYVTDNHIAYKTEHSWNIFGEQAQAEQVKWLNLFPNLRFISGDHKNDLWIINRDNELYKFSQQSTSPLTGGNPIVLRATRNGEVKSGAARELKFEEDKNTFTFEVIQPNFLCAPAIEYRYELAGMEQGWTDWGAANNVINFSYLPSGEYTLRVQARDIFGRVESMKDLSFEVLPPYWRRPWFYGLEAFVFASLVLLSFRLSTRYRIVSRLLSMLTIIMLIQFIQTGIGQLFETKTSVVIDFFVQVVVAFMILPVEGYLRNLMLRSLDGNTRLHRILARRGANQKE